MRVLLTYFMLTTPTKPDLFRFSINTCRLHGSPTHHPHHHHSGGGSHYHHHLMDDLALPYQDHNHHNSPMSPINLNLLSSVSTAVPNPHQTVPSGGGGLSSAGAALLDPHSAFQTNLAGGLLGVGAGKTSTNVIINTATNTTTRSNLSCCNNLFLNDGRTGGLDSSSAQLTNNNILGIDASTAVPSVPIINTTVDSGLGGSGGGTTDGGSKDKSSVGARNRWLTCPELHKAMDGVTYIADHTRKEEESTRVSVDAVQYRSPRAVAALLARCCRAPKWLLHNLVVQQSNLVLHGKLENNKYLNL